MGRKLYVGSLSPDVTARDLEELFAESGTCDSVVVISDRATGQSRGFGFVEMSSDGEAQRAIQQLNGHELKGRAIRVNEAREQGSGRSGGRGGFRGGNRW